MDSRPNHIDDTIRQALEGHEMTPDPQVWNSIEENLGMIQKPRAAGWKRILPLSLILMLTASGVYVANLVGLESSSEMAQKKTGEDIRTSDAKSPLPQTAPNFIAENTTTYSSSSNSPSDLTPVADESSAVLFSSSAVNQNNSSKLISDVEKRSVDESILESGLDGSFDSNKKDGDAQGGANSDANSMLAVNAENSEESQFANTAGAYENDLASLGHLGVGNLDLEPTNGRLTDANGVFTVPSGGIGPGTAYSRFSLGAFFSSDWSYRRVSMADEELKADLDSREDAKLVSTVGLMGQYDLGKRFSIMSGVLVTDKGLIHRSEKEVVMNEPEDPDNEPQEQVATLIDDRFLFEIDQGGGNSDGIIAVSGDYTYRYLEVPFMLKYSVPIKSFNLYAATGLSASFLLTKQAIVQYAQNGRFVEEQVELTSPINRVLFGSNLLVGVEYEFADGWYAGVAPNARYSFTTVTNNEHMKVNPFSLGGALTFRKRL